MSWLTLDTARSRPTSFSHPLLLRQWLLHATRLATLALLLATSGLALHEVVPAYLASQAGAIALSAAHQGVPPSWLAAVFYNELLGTEDAVLQQILPGDNAVVSAARQILLGLHFSTLKQAQWQAKTAIALLGGDPTVGPAGIRITVGREIRYETKIVGGNYVGAGWLERPSMVLDLLDPATAVEYLAGNLRRGQERLDWAQRGDWAASARWHNTGVLYDSDIVRPADWDKGTRYVARVEEYLPEVAPLVENEFEADVEATARPPRGWGRDGQASRWPPTSPAQ